jgi:hypothetical protein
MNASKLPPVRELTSITVSGRFDRRHFPLLQRRPGGELPVGLALQLHELLLVLHRRRIVAVVDQRAQSRDHVVELDREVERVFRRMRARLH